ncbi:MAG: single-stranded DNA-binding protein [Clostridiales bacterium]|nr:single-stranded DNA-binding protein [Clostridiales bacterium]
MNKVFLIGNLTRDPELTETASGVKICRFAIAVNRSYTGGDGERKTDFFNCVAWRGLGETIARFTRKGTKVAVVGSIELRNYEDNQGVKRTAVDIVAQDVEFLSPRAGSSDFDEFSEPSQPASGGRAKPQLQPFDDDSDIPF